MDNIPNEYTNNDDYESLYKSAVNHIEQAKNNIEVIKEKAIVEIHWNLGETLLKTGDLPDGYLIDLRNHVNNEMRKDPILRRVSTNTHWLKLATLWVREHLHQDKKVMLSGSVTWIQWALLLDIVNSAPQRYWLACQTIKQGWDVIALLRAARSLPEKYLNFG